VLTPILVENKPDALNGFTDSLQRSIMNGETLKRPWIECLCAATCHALRRKADHANLFCGISEDSED